ncbi:serine/threonine-protein kinase pim-1-like [Cyclopterus lumpus]|uniref:serine/threonine-protein kinase pim-1-like n=1 Tax=Cyclopterus lumpus TaxID=8103 RepID=UPI0014873A38|nr:serine/threonine-protein kinase pim-1-like [Cyclopterus lumpus]
MGKVFGKLFTAVEKEELPSSSEDIGVVAARWKRKQTEDGESLPRKRKSGNTPEAALSEGSAKRKAVDDDGPVAKKYRLLDESDVFKAKYQQLKKLGQGSFGCVFAGYRRADNLPVAIKHIDRKKEFHLSQEDDGYTIPMEVDVLEHLQANSEQHSAPVHLLDWYVEEQGLILVLERPMPAVNLCNYILDKGGHLKETEAKIIINQLVDAAIDLQENHIFHRDIKPENLLIETCMKSPRLRLIDFGLSCFVEDGDTHDVFYGSYVPPEWYIHEKYEAGPSTVYQIGVVLFPMFHGVSYSENLSFEKLKNGRRISQHPDQWFPLEQLRNHPWLK